MESLKEGSTRSKILTRFIKRKISLSPMETILSILSELEYFESLVKLIRKKCDENTITTNVIGVEEMLIIRKICINKSHHNKTLDLLVKINNNLINGLVDTRASVFVMAIGVVWEIMHLVTGF
jgi:hypothetical protein